MHDIVLITSYNRPDYLRLCLDYLARAEGVETKEIRLYVDRGRGLIREFYEVLNDFKHLNIQVTFRPEHTYHGNSYNTLEAYKEAYHTNAEFVYLIEDDVLITKDFFKWHEAVQARGDYLCSIGYRCIRNSEALRSEDPCAYFESSRDFASIGVCWRRTRLAAVIRHAREEYYQDLNGYLAKRFANNRFADSFTEQDGLIMRILGESHDTIAWCCRPRCWHTGFTGYHRLRSPRLSYDQLKEVIHDPLKVKACDLDFGDIEAVPTEEIPSWNKNNLYCLQRFE